MAEVPGEVPDVRELGERRDKSFSRRVALTTAVYAVVLAIASLGGSNAMKHMLLAQQQSSDQWAFYQAKVVREHLYRAQRLSIALALTDPTTLRGAERAKYMELANRLDAEEQRYNAEKKEVEQEARTLERERDRYRTRDPYFEGAAVFLQIAIVTASVAILATSRPMFAFSLVLATLGTLSCVNGFLELARVPWLHGS